MNSTTQRVLLTTGFSLRDFSSCSPHFHECTLCILQCMVKVCAATFPTWTPHASFHSSHTHHSVIFGWKWTRKLKFIGRKLIWKNDCLTILNPYYQGNCAKQGKFGKLKAALNWLLWQQPCRKDTKASKLALCTMDLFLFFPHFKMKGRSLMWK